MAPLDAKMNESQSLKFNFKVDKVILYSHVNLPYYDAPRSFYSATQSKKLFVEQKYLLEINKYPKETKPKQTFYVVLCVYNDGGGPISYADACVTSSILSN